MFCSAALVLVVSASAFLVLGSGTEQPWNVITTDPVELRDVNPPAGEDQDSLSPLADQKSLSPDSADRLISPENCISESSVDKNDIPSTSGDKNSCHQNKSVLEKNNVSSVSTAVVEPNGISRVSTDVDIEERDSESEAHQSLLPPA